MDLGSGILKKPIPDPGSRIQGSKRHRIPDPGSGSATLPKSETSTYVLMVFLTIFGCLFVEKFSKKVLLVSIKSPACKDIQMFRKVETSCDSKKLFRKPVITCTVHCTLEKIDQ